MNRTPQPAAKHNPSDSEDNAKHNPSAITDTERLDWLDKRYGDSSDWEHVFNDGKHPYRLRDTIDAAIQQERTKES